MSSWESIAGNLYNVFYNGGPSALVWGFLIVWIGAMAQAASLAEMASVQPIAGAMYHWTWSLAPLNMRRFATWIQDWLTWAGWVSMTVGIGNSTSNWITSLVQLNFPGYVSEGWHGTLMIYAMVGVAVGCNLWKFGKVVPWMETVAGVWHVVLFIVFSIVLLAMAPKNSAEFVFLSRVDSAQTSGWTNGFVSWNLALQTPVWSFVGKDFFHHLFLFADKLSRLRRSGSPQRGGVKSPQHRTKGHGVHEPSQWSDGLALRPDHSIPHWQHRRSIEIPPAHACRPLERYRITSSSNSHGCTLGRHQHPGHGRQRRFDVSSNLVLGSRWGSAENARIRESLPLTLIGSLLLIQSPRSTPPSASQPAQSSSPSPSSSSSPSSTSAPQ